MKKFTRRFCHGNSLGCGPRKNVIEDRQYISVLKSFAVLLYFEKFRLNRGLLDWSCSLVHLLEIILIVKT